MDTIWYVLITGFGTSFFTWLFSYGYNKATIKKLKVEVDGLKSLNKGSEITNIDAAIDTWQKIVDSLEGQIERLLEQKGNNIAEKLTLENRLDQLMKLRESDAREIADMKKEIEELNQTVSNLKGYAKENEELKKRIKKYEKLLTDNNIAF